MKRVGGFPMKWEPFSLVGKIFLARKKRMCALLLTMWVGIRKITHSKNSSAIP